MSAHLKSFVYFRAIAMIFIVAGHSYDIAHFAPGSFPTVFVGNILSGGTTFFVFVSGYLFHHVFYNRYAFRSFFAGKTRNALIPYCLLSVPFIFYFVQVNPQFYSDQFALSSGQVVIVKVVTAIVMLLTGSNFLMAYWYVPFIMLTFALSPLHYRFVGLGPRAQIRLISGFLVVSVFLHRSVDNYNPLQSVLYFTPVYLLGIFVSLNRGSFLTAVKGKEIHILALGLLIAALQSGLGHDGNYHKAAFAFGGIDLMLLQKILLSLAIFACLERAAQFRSRILQVISRTSFAIYFLHPILLFGAGKAGLAPPSEIPWLDLVICTTVLVAISVAIAEAARKIFGAESRLLLGY